MNLHQNQMDVLLRAKPLLTVIIVSWRVPDLLRGCLRSLLAESALPGGALEIVVVDNASGDETVEMVRGEFPEVRLIEQPENLGFGRANTLAFEQTRSEYVLLLNPDTVISDRGIARLLAHMQAHPDVAAMGCRLCNGDGSLQRWTGGRFPTLANVAAHYLLPARLLSFAGVDSSLYLARDVKSDVEADWVSGACLLLRRSQVPAPLFDPAYWMYGEDIDLCRRIRAAGGRVVYTPIVTVKHLQGASMRQLSGDAMLSSLKGLRLFYARQSGPICARALDVLTVVGFGLRWVLYRLGALVSRNAALEERARSSARYVQLAFRLLRG
ncbi:MAG: glycosyltransferase family 2 protein [Methylocella sp.]